MTDRIVVNALKMNQPMGQFLVAVFPHEQLLKIASADIRQMSTELDDYIGIQRKINDKRVKEIGEFSQTLDATFPTSIVVAISSDNATFDEKKNQLTISPSEETELGDIAKILDGQHRLEGLKTFKEGAFELSVTVLIDADISDQAYIFATVNLAQTKVNKSLVYDLLDYQTSRSPQKTSHDVAVSLDSYSKSPLFEKIKRLGHRTPGRMGESLSQAVVVGMLIPMISRTEVKDRDLLARGKRLPPIENLAETPFRELFVDGKDEIIASIVMNFFRAVVKKWPVAWNSQERGDMLSGTNGFKALMRLMKDAYLQICNADIGREVSESEFAKVVNRATLKDSDFTIENFKPGTSGENALYRKLKEQCRV